MNERAFDIGGFIGLEGMDLGKEYTGPHPDAIFLTSGRACMAHVLDLLAPRRILVPFFTCNSLLLPAKERGVEINYLPINDQLRFIADPEPGEGDLVVLIDHFGVRTKYQMELADQIGTKAVLDLTHSFYTKPGPGNWGFNSARKFFGVPDGGFLFGPSGSNAPELRNETVHGDHLILRAISSGEDVLRAFRTNEARMTTKVLRASALSELLLRKVDWRAAQQTRMANFSAVHAVLGPSNALELDDTGTTGPLCYPFLTDAEVDLARFHARGIFAARYWPDLDSRPEKVQFPMELRLSRRLIAVPIDQRYSADELVTVAEAVRSML